MGSNDTATATTGGPRVIDFFDGNGARTGPNYTLFFGADRLLGVSRVRSGSGQSPAPHTRRLGLSEGSGSHCQVIHGFVGRTDERIGRNMLEAAAHAV